MKDILTHRLSPINNFCLLILAITASTWLLVYTKTMLMPFVIALFISMVAGTSAEWLKRKAKVPYKIGLVLSFISFLALITMSVLFISGSIESFVSGADIYEEKLNSTVDWFLIQAQHYGIKFDAKFVADNIAKLPVFTMLQSVGSTVMSIFTNLMLITLFTIFIFMGKANAEKRTFVGNLQKQISFYLLVKLSVSFMAAGCTWLVLTTTKTELALMLAVLTFVLNFIPNVGPLISTISPLPVIFLQYGFDWHICLVLILLTAIHFVIGNIIETKWLGKGMDLDPIVVIASLIFWALVWGIMGALLAVPLTAVLKMFCDQHESTKPLANILSGRYSLK